MNLYQKYNEALEKIAYNYTHEARELEDHHKKNQNKQKTHAGRSALEGATGGAALGASFGALLSDKGKRGKSALIGTGIGALGGAAVGAGASATHNRGIENSKKIMAMPKKHRRDKLRAEARKNERLGDDKYRAYEYEYGRPYRGRKPL